MDDLLEQIQEAHLAGLPTDDLCHRLYESLRTCRHCSEPNWDKFFIASLVFDSYCRKSGD